MSIFKKLFSNDIILDTSKAKGLVYPHALKRSSIKLDSKVQVPENYSFAIGNNGRCLDCFLQGEYYLSISTLPECCKKLKIHKTDKNNKIKKSFKADAYFVSLNEFTLNLKTQQKAELGGKASGIFKVGLICDLKLKVQDTKKLMNFLLSEYAYLKQNEAEKIILSYISEYVVTILYNYNFALSEFISSNPIIIENLKSELGVKLSKLGLQVVEMYNVTYILPKKYQKDYELNLKANKNTQKEFDENLNVENIIQEDNQNDKDAEQEYIPYGKITIENQSDIQQIDQNSNNISQQENENNNKEQEFVDLNLENLYNNNKKGKKCSYCGLVNANQNINCELCGNRLKGE